MNIKTAILKREIENIKKFLKKFNLTYDDDIDFTLYIEDEEIIGTISCAKNIIKAFAVDPSFKGSIASKLISEAIQLLFENGYNHYQVYTKPENIEIFKSFNFYEIVSSNEVSLLESKNRSILEVLNNLKTEYNLFFEDAGCIVMNCNPFTLGHRYLIEEASKLHDALIIFVLEEEKSQFTFKERIELIKLGCKDLLNVRVVPSTNYLISSLTFPTYFLKREDEKISAQAKIDALIFKKYFIPIFNLKKRYLGSEEDYVTNIYNNVLQNTLGNFINIIDRKRYNNKIISASRVRELLKNKDFEEIKNLVPITTYEYLRKKYE